MNSNKLRIIGVIGMIILLGMLAYFLYVFKTNVELFQNDPFRNGLILHNFDGCTCNKGDEIWYANSTAIWKEPTGYILSDSPRNFTLQPAR